MDEQLLLRTWSVDALYGPGAQSDEMITFNADGTGFLEQLNWGCGSVVAFRWSFSSGRLEIVSEREFQVGEEEGLVPIDSASEKYETRAASITSESLPLGSSYVLRLPGFAKQFFGVGEDGVFGYDPSIAPRSYAFPS